MNLSPHARGGCESRSEESRQRQSETIRSNPELLEKARNSMKKNGLKKGYKASEAHRKNNSEVRRGRTQSQETKDKRAESHRGRKNTPETIELMRQSALKRAEEQPTYHSVKTKKKISRQQKGRIWINDGQKNQRLFPADAEPFFALGWVRGKLGACGSGLWVHRMVDGSLERNRVPEEELQKLLDQGWVRGTGPQS